MSNLKNIDDLIVNSTQEQNVEPESSDKAYSDQQEIAPRETYDTPKIAPRETYSEDNQEETSEKLNEKTQQPINNEENNVQSQEKDHHVDEYGNPVEKPKVYTEEEVNRMIRERLARGRHQEQQPIQQEVRQATDNFKADPDSDDSWEVQLENFIEKTIEKRHAKLTEQQWKQQESQRQAEFETKFTSGMNKYGDFQEVVAGKPITDTMMLATRSLENPAAFIYGAAKMHPQELEQISRITDPYAQAAAIGRLHEKMVKTRNMISNAPKPIETPKGDLPVKTHDTPSLEERIHSYGRQKLSRR